MNEKKGKILGGIGTLCIHLALFLFLYITFIREPEEQVEGGVPVILGDSELAGGNLASSVFTEVDVLKENVSSSEEISEEAETKEDGERMLTQEDEPTVSVVSGKKEKVDLHEKKKNKETENKPEGTKTEKKGNAGNTIDKNTEAEKKMAAEKKAAELANKRITGAFGKGSKMENAGNGQTGDGKQGSPEGNSSTGKLTGTGGYGTFDLNGRSLGEGSLPMPVYEVQDEGRVVVTITVNPAGIVIGAAINKRTNTVNAKLRNAALEAARKARFNSIKGVDNQTGTITYYFKLK